ncbi:unnamed protein product [Choristocarpus tenellus]
MDSSSENHDQSNASGTAKDPGPSIRTLKSALECAVCLALVCEPVSLSCGHTFCRSCIVSTLRRNKKKCPVCRAVCHNNAEDQPENVMITQIVNICFPEEARQRLTESAGDRSSWKSQLPVFYYNLPMFPGETLHLHLFEPRYKLMMQRIVNTSRRFGYIPNYTNYDATLGDVALIAEVCECEFLSDGRVLLEAKLIGRYTVVDHFVEEGTQGLHYCQLEARGDDPPVSREGAVLQAKLHEEAQGLVNRVIGPVKAQVISTHGEMPTSAEGLSMWIASILPMPVPEKHRHLSGKSTIKRLEGCISLLSAMGASGKEEVDRSGQRRASQAAAAAAAMGSGLSFGSEEVGMVQEGKEGGDEGLQTESLGTAGVIGGMSEEEEEQGLEAIVVDVATSEAGGGDGVESPERLRGY